MLIPSRAQALAVCHDCRLRHPCFTLQGYRDFCERHPGHRVSYLDRDWLYEAHASPLAAWDPRKLLVTARGWLDVLRLRRAARELDHLALRGYTSNADVKQAFGTSTAITQTLASLAQAAARESTAVDNTSNLYLDAFVRYHVKLQTGTPASDKAVYVHGYASEDGTNYTDNATGSDAALTMRSPTNLRLIGTIATPDSGGLTYKSMPFAASMAFQGMMPRKWGTVVENLTNITLSATEGDHTKAYSGVYATVI